MNSVEIQLQLGRKCRSGTLGLKDSLTFDSLLRLTECTFPTCKHRFIVSNEFNINHYNLFIFIPLDNIDFQT
jgi:hypothetical protein